MARKSVKVRKPGQTVLPATGQPAGVSAATAAGIAVGSGDGAAEQLDWERRSEGTGVIKSVYFPTATNVNNYRFTNENTHGWDPTSVESHSNLVRWEAGEGLIPGTGCLRCESITSGGTPVFWWLNLDPDLTSGSTTESYVIEPNRSIFAQASVRMNAARLANFGTDATGLKIFELVTAAGTLKNQGCHVSRSGTRQYVQIANTASGGTFPWAYIDIGGGDFDMQPGSEYGECLYSEGDSGAGCWIIPADEWVTYLIEYIPGTVSTQNTMVRLWVQAEADTDYTMIYERQDNYITSPFEDAGGISALALWNRDEGSTGLVSGCYHDFDQVIVSREWIPPRNRVNPTWVDSLGQRVWGQPVSSTLVANKPSPEPPSGGGGGFETITVWSGGALDQIRKRPMIWGGGHAAYAGNEFYGYALNVNSPSIARLNNPTPTAQIDTGDATYADGKPVTCHSGDHIVCDEFGNFWTLGLGRTYNAGNAFGNIFKWAPLQDEWTSRGSVTSNIISVAGSSRFDYYGSAICRETGLMYVINQLGDVNSVNQSTGLATSVADPGAWPDGDTGAWEKTACVWNTPAGNRVLIVFRSNGTSKIYLMDLDNGAGGWTVKSPSSIPASIFTGIGVSWHRGSSAVLAWGHTSSRENLLKLSPSNTSPANYSAVTAATWTWSEVAPLSGATVPSNPRGQQYGDSSGTYKRAGIIENVGYVSGSSATLDAFVVLNDSDESPYVFLIPSTGV